MVTNFQFDVFSDYKNTKSAILTAARENKGRPIDNGDEIIFKISPGFGAFKVSFLVYVAEKENFTTVRIMLQGNDKMNARMKVYDKFLTSLISSGLKITAEPGTYRIVSATMIGDGTEQRFTNRLGGVATNMTKSKVKTVLAKNVTFSIHYSNGMIEEKEVKRNSKLFSELMAKLDS